MDINEALRLALEYATAIMANYDAMSDDFTPTKAESDGIELAANFLEIDFRIKNGGFLPAAWTKIN